MSGSCYVVAMECGHTQCGCYGVWSHTMWLLWSVVTCYGIAMGCGHMLWGCYVVCGEVRDRAEVSLAVLSLLLQQI